MLSQRDTANLKNWIKNAMCFQRIEIGFDPDAAFKQVATEKPLPAMLKAILNRLSGFSLVRRFLEQRNPAHYLVNPRGLGAMVGKQGSPEAEWERFLEEQYQPGAYTVFIKVNGMICGWLSTEITSDELRQVAEALQEVSESIEAKKPSLATDVLAMDVKSSLSSPTIQ
jgi:hypothetical protein